MELTIVAGLLSNIYLFFFNLVHHQTFVEEIVGFGAGSIVGRVRREIDSKHLLPGARSVAGLPSL